MIWTSSFFVSDHLALDFVNGTVSGRHRGDGEPVDRLADFPDLLDWAEAAGLLTGPARATMAAADPMVQQETLRQAQTLREACFAVVWDLVRGAPVTAPALAGLNRELAAIRQHEHLTTHPDGQPGFALAFAGPPDDPRRLLYDLATAITALLTREDLKRFHACASETCQWLFLDRTKNGKRRWCEMASCGNQAKARRHYARTKTQGAA